MSPLIEQWQRICILAERIIKRREAAAVRTPPVFFRRDYLRAHLSFPPLLSLSAPTTVPSSPTTIHTTLSDSSYGPGNSLLGLSGLGLPGDQSDLSRLTNTLRAVVEVNERCWRGDDCELSNGVRQGLEQAAAHAQRHSELSEIRVSANRGIDVSSQR